MTTHDLIVAWKRVRRNDCTDAIQWHHESGPSYAKWPESFGSLSEVGWLGDLWLFARAKGRYYADVTPFTKQSVTKQRNWDKLALRLEVIYQRRKIVDFLQSIGKPTQKIEQLSQWSSISPMTVRQLSSLVSPS